MPDNKYINNDVSYIEKSQKDSFVGRIKTRKTKEKEKEILQKIRLS